MIQYLIVFIQKYCPEFIVKSNDSLSNYLLSNVFFLLSIILIYIHSLFSIQNSLFHSYLIVFDLTDRNHLFHLF